MPRKGYKYEAHPVPKALRKSYPLKEVKGIKRVKALEYSPVGSLDVVDVKMRNGAIKSVYSFQLRSIKKVKRGKND
jgi:hypothetical protein